MIQFRQPVTVHSVLEALSLNQNCSFSQSDLLLEGATPLSQFSDRTVAFYAGNDPAKALAFSHINGLAFVRTEVFEKITAAPVTAALIGVANPRLAFIRTLARFASPPNEAPRVHPTAIISSDAKIDRSVSIGPHAVIGSAIIGPGCIIGSHVTIYDNVCIGRNCEIGPSTVIGKSGFGYEFDNDDNCWIKFPHFGGVVIEDDVHIGSNTCIDQGVMMPTVIGQGTKIDNLVHIAHNVKIGKRNMVVACAEVSGSVITGDNCWIGPNASILNGIQLGNDVFVGIRAVVIESARDKTRITPIRDKVKEL